MQSINYISIRTYPYRVSVIKLHACARARVIYSDVNIAESIKYSVTITAAAVVTSGRVVLTFSPPQDWVA